MFENVSIDWLRMTFKADEVRKTEMLIQEIATCLGLPFDPSKEYGVENIWLDTSPKYHYKKAIHCIVDSGKSIYILWDNVSDSNSIMLELSGSCCRFMEEHLLSDYNTWYDVLSRLRKVNKSKATRIDLALDDTVKRSKNHDITIEQLEDKMKKGLYTGEKYKGKRVYSVVESGKPRDSNGDPIKGKTLYIGSRADGTTQFIRIYDKLAEQLGKGIECDLEKWIRYEMVLSGVKAEAFLNEFLNTGVIFGTLYAEALNSFITFLTSSGNVWRPWEFLMKNVRYLNLPNTRKDVSILQKEKWLEEMASKNFAMICQARGKTPEEMGAELYAIGVEKLTPIDKVKIHDFQKTAKEKSIQE